MYFQSLVSDTTQLLQGAVRIIGGDQPRLAPAFNRIMGSWMSLGMASASLRLRLSAIGETELTVFIAAKTERGDALRRILARLSLLDGVAGARVELPSDAADFERLREAWPQRTLALDGDLHTAAGTPLLCRGVWPDLIAPAFARMAALGAELAVHVNIAPESPPADLQKSWARALVALDGQAVPPNLRQHQNAEFAAARKASVNIETFWGVSPDLSATLAASLDQAVHQREPALARVKLHAEARETPDAVLEALHTLVLMGEDEQAFASAAGYGSEAEAALALSFPSVPTLPRKSDPSAGEGGRFGVKWSDMPPVADRDRFCFVSYAHADAAPVYDILKRLAGRNIPYWYDRGIPAGEQWDDELEARLSSCKAVLAFLSPRSVQSRYCRREIKYADILGKPIVPIMLESTRLEGGLSFALSHIQYANAADPHLVDQLAASIDGLR